RRRRLRPRAGTDTILAGLNSLCCFFLRIFHPSSLITFHSQQLRGLISESFEFVILLFVLVHPLDGLVVPLSCLVFLIQLPVGHSQEEGVEAEHLAFEKLLR